MSTWSIRSRRAGNVALAAAAVAVAASLAAPSRPVALVHGPILAGQNHVPETLRAQPPEVVADRDTPADQLAYAEQARALPASLGGLKWQNVGPTGQDDPANGPTGPVRFSRSAGMGAAIAVDPADPTGNSVYTGTMGGLWHTTDAGQHWKALGDGQLARSGVGAVAVDPKNPSTVYAGTGISLLTNSGDTPGAGVYVSHNGGTTFSRPAQNVRGYGVNAITVLPTGVLVGTSNGLYVSTNGGASFVRVALPDNATHDAPAVGAYANWISAVVASPVNELMVTAAVGMGYGKRLSPDGKPMSPGNGLYRSTTGAAGPYTWVAGSAGLTNPGASVDPIGRVSLSYGKNAGGDKAVLWALVSDAGLLNKQQPAGLDLVGTTTGKSVNATNTLLNGLYRSDDDGATWVVKATPASLEGSPNEGLGVYPALGYGVGVQAFYNNWVAADPVHPDQVYFGLEEVFQSVSNTGSGQGLGQFDIIQRYWDVCGSTTYLENIYKGQSCPDQTPYYGGVSTHPDQHVGVLADVNGKVRMYTGNDGGFFWEDAHALADSRTGFDNKGWAQMNTLASVQPWHVGRKPDGEYLTALQDNGGGFFKPGDVNSLISSGDGVYVLPTSNADTWYMSAQGAVLYVTQDHGKTIKEIQPDLTGAAFLSPIAMDPTDEKHLVAAAQDVQETTLGPATTTILDPVAYTVVKTDWVQSFNAGTSPTMVGGKAQPWAASAIDIRGPVVYDAICALCRNTLGDPKLINATVATNVKAGCTPKTGAADCWHVAAGKGLPHASISGVAIDPANVNTIYVTMNEFSLVGFDHTAAGSQRVLVSHDAGEHFTDISGNLPRSNARDIVIRDNKLIVATDHGVFTAPETGNAWSRLGAGLPAVRIFDLYLDPTGRYLTIGAYGRGVWVFDFQAKATTSSSGKGAHGETNPPKTGPQIPTTGIRPGLAIAAMLFAGFGVALRRLSRSAA